MGLPRFHDEGEVGKSTEPEVVKKEVVPVVEEKVVDSVVPETPVADVVPVVEEKTFEAVCEDLLYVFDLDVREKGSTEARVSVRADLVTTFDRAKEALK